MRKISLSVFVFAQLCYVFSFIPPLSAEEVSAEKEAGNKNGQATNIREDMQDAYGAFERLQPFFADSEAFKENKNQAEISRLLGNLADSFHSLDDVDSRFQDEPGFNVTLELMQEAIGDAAARFDEGKKSYALWRLRGLSSHCVSCHMAHHPELTFHDEPDITSLTSYEQGNFYLSTRQYSDASQAFLKALRDSKDSSTSMNALRKWLLVKIRATTDPKEAYSTLEILLSTLELPVYKREEVEGWLLALKRWADEEPSARGLSAAENILQTAGLHDYQHGRTDTVSVLRAITVLHSILYDRSLSKAERGRVFYLLGFSYSRLPLFFISEMPEIYLQLAIKEVPGSDQAKAAFNLYKDLVYLDFTGSGGTHIPDDVAQRLENLHQEAFGLVPVDEEVDLGL